MKHTDHKGITYPDFGSMAEAYGLKYKTAHMRIRSGWSVEKALTTPSEPAARACTDHKGNKYSSITEMAKAYGLSYAAFTVRRKRGMTIEKALTTKCHRGVVYDHKGIKYASKKDMAEAYGLDPRTVAERLERQGWSLREALEGKDAIYTSEAGETFKTVTALAEAYGIKRSTLAMRLKSGMTIEEALALPCKGRSACK